MPGPPRKNNHPLTGYCHNVKALARQQVITANPRAGHARPLRRSKKQKEAVAQGKNPSAAASLRLNASRSTKTLAIDPLISKKQITQTGPSEKRLFSRGACFPNFQKSEIQVCFRLNQMQILQSTVALCQQVSNVLGKPQKQKLRQDFDFTAGKETLEIPIVL